MRQLERLQDLLPPPYTAEPSSVLTQLLDAVAVEMEVLSEELDRVRRTHWVNFAYRFGDLEKLATLLDIEPLPWEGLRTFRARLLALVVARLRGALGPNEIRAFVYDYLLRTEEALAAVLVPGLGTLEPEAAFAPDPERPRLRTLALVENPPRLKRSTPLLARGGRVPYLFTWQENNRGLDVSVASFRLSGYADRRTTVPILANLTTGELIGYSGTVGIGSTLSLRPAGDPQEPRAVAGQLGDEDVTAKLFSVSGFVPGVPFGPDDLDPAPLLPRMARGANRWVYLSVGLFDIEGLNRFFYAIADDKLKEGVFDDTSFDNSLFRYGDVARLEMEWIEAEGASFEVRVPRYLVVERGGLPGFEERPWELVGQALAATIQRLRAAGVRAAVRFEPFSETQDQKDRLRPSWKILDPEEGPSGRESDFAIGGRYGESPLGRSRFE